MTTLSQARRRNYEAGNSNGVPVAAATRIFEGAAVGLVTATGYARPLNTDDTFIGFASATVDNRSGAAGALNVDLVAAGSVELPVTGAVITSLKASVYASDDDTFNLVSGVYIGEVKRYVSAGVVVVAFDAKADLSDVVRKVYNGSGQTVGLVGDDGNTIDVLMSVQGDEIAAPSSSATPATGSAGALTGTYGYAVTFVTAQGETAPWAGTVTTVTPSSQRVNLTGIPIGPAGTTARRIYRTIGAAVDVKDYFYLTEIADNTTTTYTDNAADGTLGDPINWAATNRGIIREGGTTQVAVFSDQATAFGQGAMATNAGYACTAFGFEALKLATSGRRNSAFGVYALQNVTVGYENNAFGVHAGDSVTTGAGNTFFGYDAGSNTTTTNFNVAVGSGALTATGSGSGSGNVAVGYRALGSINTADQCIGLGYFAGRYANASRQVFIDTADRTNITNAQNIGLIYGKGEATAIAQVLHLNAPVRVGPPSLTVSSLPAASSTYTGFRAFVTDANATTFASTVAGGGSNVVPVFCTGSAWIIA